MTKINTSILDVHQQAFAKLLHEFAPRHRLHDVFRDFVEMAAISLSNPLDVVQAPAREARYLELAGRYDRLEHQRIAGMMAQVVFSLERGLGDCLGQLFMALEFGNEWRGQFFSPFEVSMLMASLLLGDVREEIEQRGFLTVSEPAVGAGGMIIAMANHLRLSEINYQNAMHAVAVDIDRTAVHMCYIQLALLHVPAIVIQGDSLAMTGPWEHWVTPAHVLGGWDRRLATRRRREQTPADHAPVEEAPAPRVPTREDIAAQRLQAAAQFALF